MNDGSCRRAAGTGTDFCSIARYVAYYEEDGSRDLARALYARLTLVERDWAGADLEAASAACAAGLDLGSIIMKARRLLT